MEVSEYMPLAFIDFMWFSRLSARTIIWGSQQRGKKKLMKLNK